VDEKERPDYGIDAPVVVRNLCIAGAALWLVALAANVGLLPSELIVRPSDSLDLRFPLVSSGLYAGFGFLSGAAFLYFGSRFGKISERERLLDRLEWTGGERVLDVGCGRGLVLVGAAKRAKHGKAVGVDIWQAEDLSDNRPGVALCNAGIEGVGERVSISTADMRRLPFADATFDVIVSRAAIHNLYSAADRAAAIREITRVLRPGGRALIADIRHHREYARTFAESGCREVRLLDSRLVSLLFALCTCGSLRPNVSLARKT
jgi:SAM-dependent methyltransferase